MIVKKTFSLLANLFFAIKYSFINIFSTKSGVTKKQYAEYPIIISLTCKPSRLKTLYLCTETLLNQSLKPNRISLWLSKPEVSGLKLPKSLLRQQKRGLEIHYSDDNFKAYNKLVHTLKKWPSSIVVTSDDDLFYPKWWLLNLFKTYQLHPSCIVCYRATIMGKTPEGKLTPYIEWQDNNSIEPNISLFATGVTGILYPPNTLSPDITNSKLFTNLSPLNDDIWYKAMALLKKTLYVKVFPENKEFQCILGSQKKALLHLNVQQNQNDQQLSRVFDKYSHLIDLTK